MLRLCFDACIWYQPKYATCASCDDAVEKKRVDGVVGTLACDDDPQRRGDACFFKQRSAWAGDLESATARRASRPVKL